MDIQSADNQTGLVVGVNRQNGWLGSVAQGSGAAGTG